MNDESLRVAIRTRVNNESSSMRIRIVSNENFGTHLFHRWRQETNECARAPPDENSFRGIPKGHQTKKLASRIMSINSATADGTYLNSFQASSQAHVVMLQNLKQANETDKRLPRRQIQRSFHNLASHLCTQFNYIFKVMKKLHLCSSSEAILKISSIATWLELHSARRIQWPGSCSLRGSRIGEIEGSKLILWPQWHQSYVSYEVMERTSEDKNAIVLREL